jgi:hypothetical protein
MHWTGSSGGAAEAGGCACLAPEPNLVGAPHPQTSQIPHHQPQRPTSHPPILGCEGLAGPRCTYISELADAEILLRVPVNEHARPFSHGQRPRACPAPSGAHTLSSRSGGPRKHSRCKVLHMLLGSKRQAPDPALAQTPGDGVVHLGTPHRHDAGPGDSEGVMLERPLFCGNCREARGPMLQADRGSTEHVRRGCWLRTNTSTPQEPVKREACGKLNCCRGD